LTHRLEVLPDAEAAAARAADVIATRARRAARAVGRFTFAVSGGTTPARMLALLAEGDVPWRAVGIWQVDERTAPPSDPDRNLTVLLATLPEGVELHPMPVERQDLEAAAAAYEEDLPGAFDLVHLGLGADGHTASLVPGDPALEVGDRDVTLTGAFLGRRRMTLTYPVLDRARGALWLVTGVEKAEALRRLVGHDPGIPAGRVRTARQLIVADRAAAARV
jgi:6-phosphogluconolactonase